MKLYHSKKLNEAVLAKIKSKLKKEFRGCKKIAVKTHFGEPGNEKALKPEDVKQITDVLQELSVDFFLYDSSVAYGGKRGEPSTHKEYAISKGWEELGEIRTGDDYLEVKGKHMTYQVCKELAKVDGVLVVSHVKGHICSGFGGAVKNLGMGALTKKTKSEIHAGGEPVFSGECRRCKACEKACPLGTLKVDDTPIFRTCYGCSNCVYACEYGLIKPKIAVFDKLLAEGANAAQSTFKKKYYINLVFRITKECDCEKDPGRIIGKDCGIIFGEDGVAVDKASHDLICKISGEDVFLKWNKKSGVEHIRQAEQAGMGSMKYEMEEV